LDAFMYESGQQPPLPDLLSSHQSAPPPPYTTLPPTYRSREDARRRGWRSALPGFYSRSGIYQLVPYKGGGACTTAGVFPVLLLYGYLSGAVSWAVQVPVLHVQ
jgi:hypothetical protein